MSGQIEEIEDGWELLKRAMLNYECGSPAQLLAWESGVSRLPEQMRNGMPSLTCLIGLAEKAWSNNNHDSLQLPMAAVAIKST